MSVKPSRQTQQNLSNIYSRSTNLTLSLHPLQFDKAKVGPERSSLSSVSILTYLAPRNDVCSLQCNCYIVKLNTSRNWVNIYCIITQLTRTYNMDSDVTMEMFPIVNMEREGFVQLIVQLGS